MAKDNSKANISKLALERMRSFGSTVNVDTEELYATEWEDGELRYDVNGTLDRSFVREYAELKKTDYLTDEQIAKDTRIAALLDLIIAEGVSFRATDIQISIPTTEVMVRYRVNGKMLNVRTIDRGAFYALSCRVKLLSNLVIEEAKVPQDGRFTVDIKGSLYDIRVSTIPTNKGENVSLRLLYSQELDRDLDTMGLPEGVLSRFRNAIMRREGLILLTGPTGSGKTTTLYTAIGELIDTYEESKNIMTIEDPVEYAIDGVVQSQVDLLRGYDFGNGLRALLRQNPDIILVGEIRDDVTAATAVRASNTGHLVFSTLHASDAVSTAIVMKMLKVEPHNISNSLKIVLNQRLMGCLCPHCKEKRFLTSAEREIFPEVMYTYDAVGCVECNYEGRSGLVLIVEMLEITDKFKELIARELTAEEMQKMLKGDPSYYSLREDLIRHLKSGAITIKDAIHLS